MRGHWIGENAQRLPQEPAYRRKISLKRRVLLHIGLEKAASTSLQGALVDSRAALAAHGVAFPAIGGGGAKDQRDLRLGLEGNAEARARAVAALREVAAGEADTLLLAGETFYRIGVAPIRAVLSDSGWGDIPIEAFAVIRDAPGWLNSRYAFGAIQFRHREGFAAYARKAVERGDVDWYGQFAPWMDAAGIAFHAVPLADRRDPRSVVVRALEAMGLGFVPEGPRRNEAVDPRTAEAGRRLAAYRLAKGGDPAVRPARRVMLESAAREKFDGRFQGLDAAITEAIESRRARKPGPLRPSRLGHRLGRGLRRFGARADGEQRVAVRPASGGGARRH